jgi:hypothetical protein
VITETTPQIVILVTHIQAQAIPLQEALREVDSSLIIAAEVEAAEGEEAEAEATTVVAEVVASVVVAVVKAVEEEDKTLLLSMVTFNQKRKFTTTLFSKI